MTERTATTQTAPWHDRAIDLLRSQRELAARLADLAQRQGSLIRSGRTDALLGLLAQRQQIIDRFTAVQEELAGLMPEGRPPHDAAPEEARSEVRSLIEQINQSLSTILGCDEQDREALRSGRAKAREELDGFGRTQQARHAYRAAPAVTNQAAPRFADQRG